VALPARSGRQRLADLLHDVRVRAVAHRVDGVHAQAVEAELLHPVERVVHEEVAHGARARAVEVDGRSPRRAVRWVEELGAVTVQVVALGSEVVVDHVEQHHQPEAVRRVDQRLEFVGRAVGGIGRELQHAVVAPVALARNVRERHHLHRRHAQFRQLHEPLARRVEGAFGGERTHVQLVHHRLFPRAAAPCTVSPRVAAWVGHHARTVNVAGVEARGGVGHRGAVGQLEPVAVAMRRAGQVEPVPAVRVAGHGVRGMFAAHRAVFEMHDVLRRCPEREGDAAVVHGGTEGHRVHVMLRRCVHGLTSGRLSTTSERH